MDIRLSSKLKKGWEKDPRGEGIFNMVFAVFCLIIGNIASYIIDGDIMPVWIDIIFLTWGILSYCAGILLDKRNKNINKRQNE